MLSRRLRIAFWQRVHMAAQAAEQWSFRRFGAVANVKRVTIPPPPRKKYVVSMPPTAAIRDSPMPISAVQFERCPQCGGDFDQLIANCSKSVGCIDCGWPQKRATADIAKFSVVPRAWRLPQRKSH